MVGSRVVTKVKLVDNAGFKTRKLTDMKLNWEVRKMFGGFQSFRMSEYGLKTYLPHTKNEGKVLYEQNNPQVKVH